jgi:hypothetical protein
MMLLAPLLPYCLHASLCDVDVCSVCALKGIALTP